MTDVETTQTQNDALLSAPVAYDDTLATERNVYQLLKPNTWFKGKTLDGTATKTIVGKDGTRKLEVTVAPLDARGKKAKPTVKMVVWPWIRRANGTKPNTDKQVYFLSRTLDPDFPQYGKRKKTGGWMDAVGNTCDKAAYQAIEVEVKQAINRASVDMWNDPTQLEGHVFYFNVKHRKDEKTGNIYQEVLFTRLEEPEDGVETDPDNFCCNEADLTFDTK